MALVIKDRVKEGTTTTGTGDISLAGAGATFSPFNSHMTNGDTTYYAIVHTSSGTDEWEVGVGTWNTGNTLTRTTVIDGSNGTSAVNFSGGTKNIFMVTPADKTVLLDESDNLQAISLSNFDTDDLAEGSNLYFTTARIDAHLSGGTGVTYSSGAISIGQAVGTSDNVTFNNITSTGTVTLAGDPTSALQAATKEYVDTIAAAGIHYHTPVRVEAPSNLNATYDNGTAGVGATLTNAGTNAAITIDGVALSSADRVLVYNQTNAAHNGIYTVTTVGDGSTAWVLTRATDADSYGSSDKDALGEGDAFFVKEGDTGAGELYVMNTSGTITFGTTNITFTVIAETAVYSAGDSLTLTGTTFDTVQDIRTTASPTFAGVTAPLTGNVTGNVTGNLTGNVTGNLTGNVTGNADTATALATARTIQLSGDVTGSATFDGSANINITAAVVDDSHAHVISNVDGLQAALDAKADDSTTITAGNGLTGGGTLGVNTTLTVGAGTGVTVNANDVAIGQDVATTANVTFNNITVTGTVDGRDVAADGSKLDGIESGATADQTITAGSGLTGGGTGNVTLSHADTSTQASVNNSGATVIQDVTVDTYGHVTGLGSKTLTYSDVGAQVAGTYNTIIGTDTDIDTSGSTIIDNIYVTDGVITSMGTRTLTLADLGYTGATNANYITNNNQLTNGAGYTTYTANQSVNTSSNVTFNQIYTNDWFRVNYSNGVYWQDYGGGWQMTDTSWMRVYNDKGVLTGGTMQAGNFNTTSDIKLKENVVTLENSLDKIKAMRGVSFDWKDSGKSTIGLIAQEVEQVLPELVEHNEEDDVKTVSYGNIVAVLIEAIKEQQEQIDALKEQLNS